MTTIEDKLNHEINWRIGEISIIKSLPYLYAFSQGQRDVLIKHTIPILYSLWEGFVVESLEIYSHEINVLKIPTEQINPALRTHVIDMTLCLYQQRIDFDAKLKLIDDIYSFLGKSTEISVQVPTESNVNFKVINRILRRFNLPLFPEDPYKKWLDTLLFFRNKLSHGENSILVSQEKVNEMSLIVISSIHHLAELITDGYNNKSYLR